MQPYPENDVGSCDDKNKTAIDEVKENVSKAQDSEESSRSESAKMRTRSTSRHEVSKNVQFTENDVDEIGKEECVIATDYPDEDDKVGTYFMQML